MESTAADSLIIVCFVEVSQSCREKRHHGAHVTFQGQMGWVGTGRALAACACFGAGSQESPGTDVHVNYLVNSAGTFQSVSAMSLLLWGCPEAADPPVARTELRHELQGAALQCHLGGVSWIQLPPSSVAWGTHATSVRPLCLSFSAHSQSCVQMSGANISPSSFSLLLHTDPTRHCTHVRLLPAPTPT